MLVACPVTLRQANAFIAGHHRHHKPARGRVGVADARRRVLCGVAIVGRPVSRVIQEREPLTCEITRLCTDGTRNACSFLYGACRRVAFILGYRRVITYTLPAEGGHSLQCAGFLLCKLTEGGSWDTPSRRRTDKAPTGPKWLWEATK